MPYSGGVDKGLQAALHILLLLVRVILTDARNGCPGDFICTCISSLKYDPFGPDETLVDCSSLGMVSIPPLHLFRGVRVKEMLFNNNDLRQIKSRQFDGVNVSYISISNNPIHDIAKDAFDGVIGLKSLVMTGCNLTEMPDIFEYITDLADLSIDKNNISFIRPQMFEHLEHLHFLDISWNPITFQADMFVGLEETIRDLRLNGLGLRRIPVTAIGRLRHLENLELQHNHFTRITADTFVGLPRNRFTHYIFDKNHIHHISPDAFTNHPTPVFLDFHGNKIKHVDFIQDPCYFKSSIIHLHGNPIHCDCTLYNVTKYNGVLLHGECTTPAKYRRLPIMTEPNVQNSYGGTPRSWATYGAAECDDPKPSERIECPCIDQETIEAMTDHDRHHMSEMTCGNYHVVGEDDDHHDGNGSPAIMATTWFIVSLTLSAIALY